MKHIKALLGLSALLVIPMFAAFPTAKAATSLTCVDNGGNDVTTITPLKLNTHVKCDPSTTNTHVNFVAYSVMNPNGIFTISPTQVAGKTAHFEFDANIEGTWTVVVVFLNQHKDRQAIEIADFNVSFSVLPESPIGTAALVGSSIAALGGFMAFRQHRVRP